jgi:predicted adenine nucleotide alpha hydrolase (AANH) superfamily ATPase
MIIESFFQAQRDCKEEAGKSLRCKNFIDLNDELTKHNENTLSERMLTGRILTTLSKDYDNFTVYGIPSVQTNRR